MGFVLSVLLPVTYLTLIYLFITLPSLPRVLDWPPKLIPVLGSSANWQVTISRCLIVLQAMGKIFCLKFLPLMEEFLSSQFFPENMFTSNSVLSGSNQT